MLCDGCQNAAFSIAPLAMMPPLASSVDFTFSFYRSRVVVATLRRHRHTGWMSTGLGRPLTTTVWLAAASVIVVVASLITVANCCSHILDDDQQTSVNDASSSAAATSTARRRRLKNTFRSRESKLITFNKPFHPYIGRYLPPCPSHSAFADVVRV